MAEKPRVFVGSSSERLKIAEHLAERLEEIGRVTVWNEDVFRPTRGTLESLVKELPTFDFAVFILGPDDTTTSRRKRQNSPRDNLLLECGLSIGFLGRERTFLVRDTAVNLKLPSDLAGAALVGYDGGRIAESPSEGVRSAYLEIAAQISKLGLGPNRRDAANHNPVGKFRGFADQQDATEYRRAYRFVGYLAQFVERRLIEAGGKKLLVTPLKENRFAAIGINDAEGTWQLVWDARGIYLNAVTLAGGRLVPARYEMAPDADWPQHSSWDEAGRVADLLLAQAAEGVRVVSERNSA